MNFADIVRSTIEELDRIPHSHSTVQFRRVLDDFAAGLSMAGIGAEIRNTRDPRTILLRTYPRHRPAQAREAVRFFFDGDEIVVVGDVTKRLSSAEDLERWLLSDFTQKSAFPDMVLVLREAATRVVFARVCADARRFSADDIAVELSAELHSAACEAAPDAVTEVRLERRLFRHVPRGRWPLSYREVDSEGVVFRIESITEGGDDDLCLRLTRVTPGAPVALPVEPSFPPT